MIVLLILIALALIALGAAVFLLGFRLGGDHGQSEVAQVRMEAACAERRLHDLTRSAFVAMAENVERRHQSHP